MKKKIILKIKTKGMMFHLGKHKFRSPATVDVTNLKIDPIISQLKLMGINDYEISTTGGITNSAEKDKSKIIIIENKNDDILNSRIEKLENIIHKILSQEKEDKNKKKDEEKEWEQNNKYVVNLSKKKDKHGSVEPNKKPVIEKIINKSKTKNNVEDELSNKKIVIEELEEAEYSNIESINIELKSQIKEFKTKDFNYEEINEPFKLSTDIEKLRKYKK